MKIRRGYNLEVPGYSIKKSYPVINMPYSETRTDSTGVAVQPPLSQAVGYVIVVVVGMVIAIGRNCSGQMIIIRLIMIQS